jgi:hypothetical protein
MTDSRCTGERDVIKSVRKSIPSAAVLLLASLRLGACEPIYDGGDVGDDAPASVAREDASIPADLPVVEDAAAASPVSEAELQALARAPVGEESVCQTFSRKIAAAALEHEEDAEHFVRALVDEFVGGTDDPFELKAGLRDGTWNQRYFYAGHGGFRAEYDDAQRYPRGGNHQPGHFVSVLAIAARFGEEQARIAIAYAGDYDPGDEDDLRLSKVAIPLGAGLREGSVTPAEVAVRARALCRS